MHGKLDGTSIGPFTGSFTGSFTLILAYAGKEVTLVSIQSHLLHVEADVHIIFFSMLNINYYGFVGVGMYVKYTHH